MTETYAPEEALGRERRQGLEALAQALHHELGALGMRSPSLWRPPLSRRLRARSLVGAYGDGHRVEVLMGRRGRASAACSISLAGGPLVVEPLFDEKGDQSLVAQVRRAFLARPRESWRHVAYALALTIDEEARMLPQRMRHEQNFHEILARSMRLHATLAGALLLENPAARTLALKLRGGFEGGPLALSRLVQATVALPGH